MQHFRPLVAPVVCASLLGARRDVIARAFFAFSCVLLNAHCGIDDRNLARCLVAETGGASTDSVGGAHAGAGGGAPTVGPEPVSQVDCPDLDLNSISDCDETIADNPRFDRNVRGWASKRGALAQWNSLDALGESGSGSVAVENRAGIDVNTTGVVYTGLTQCIPIEMERAYSLFAQVLSPAVGAGAGSIVGSTYATADCSGEALAAAASPGQSTFAKWTTVQTAVPAPSNAASLLVELTVGRANGSSGTLYFDNVLVR